MAENYVLLETIQLSQSASSVTFDNLPTSGYTDLKIVMSVRSDFASANDNIKLSFNGSTASFSSRRLYGSGSAAGSDSVSDNTNVIVCDGATSTASTFSSAELYVPNYLSANNKSYSVDSVAETNATTTFMYLVAGLRSNTAAISSITFTPQGGTNFVANSTFSLYGIAALGTTPVTAPFATGGNIVANDGTYWYHAFLSSGTFTPLKALSCDYLVVAGGGGGGAKSHNGGGGGGGGAGGLRSTVTATGGGGTLESALALLSGTAYTVTVGAGGAGTTSHTATNASNGGDSVFGSITSTGGGRGGNQGGPIKTGATGGSGGGAGIDGGDANQAGGSGTTNQGRAAGNSVAGLPYRGSGGGGAGVASSTPSSEATMAGGAGVLISAFATPTTTGVSGYYAGGGGGAGDSQTGAGGVGGGGAGAGAAGTNGVPGTANTGGGGGCTGNGFAASPGGSGIVIVRYPMV